MKTKPGVLVSSLCPKAKPSDLAQAMVQHLRHGGFEFDQIAQLMSIRSDVARDLFARAELTRPKLCQGSCIDTYEAPLCPYCQHVGQLQSRMFAVAQRRALLASPNQRERNRESEKTEAQAQHADHPPAPSPKFE